MLSLFKHNRLFSQSGRSTVEILGVLSIVGVLSVAGIAGYTKVMEKINLNTTLEQLSEIVNNIHQYKESHHKYTSLDNKSAIGLSIIPPKMVHSYEVIKHAYGGEVKLRSVSRGKGFVIVYNGLPANACVQIATAPLKFEENGLQYLMISPSGYDLPRDFPIALDNGEFAHEELPITYQQAATYCICPTSTCGIVFFFQ